MKTLADFTEEQRGKCVGMWCSILPPQPHRKGGEGVGVIAWLNKHEAAVMTAAGVLLLLEHERVAPRSGFAPAWKSRPSVCPLPTPYIPRPTQAWGLPNK